MKTCCMCGAVCEKRVCKRCKAPRGTKVVQKGDPLSNREKQVIELVAQGKGNKEIARELHLAEGTVKDYVSFGLKKVGVSNRVQLALWWRDRI